MTIAAIREKLHKYIDATDDQHVTDMLEFVENTQNGAYHVDAADFDELNRRAEDCLKGKVVTSTVEEAHNYIRENGKK
jgi:hypothetical protein